MIKHFEKIDSVKGDLLLPGDKSISHRVLIFASMAKGISEIQNLSDAQDVFSTIQCLEKLGAGFAKNGSILEVKGRGFRNFNKPDSVLDAGNSGTTARLLSGLLACQNFDSVISGDYSLCRRPMNRVADPLNGMGLNVKTTDSKLPLTFCKNSTIHPFRYKLTVASAQVKSALLIAGMHCNEQTIIVDPFYTRDHTERILKLKQVLTGEGKEIFVSVEDYPEPAEYFVPSDISTAAFFIIPALLTDDSDIIIRNVSLNPTRTKILDILIKMGAYIEILNETSSNNEPFGDIKVKSSRLHNIEIDKEDLPQIIDEIPILAVAGLFAEGEFEIKNAEELRYKESDRINSICTNLNKLGAEVKQYPDGFGIAAKRFIPEPVFDSFGDHRIAMAFAVLSSLLDKGGSIENFECINISNPGFENQLHSIIYK
jgi:3-phosphoshikimate 1-carboxyvinyltransferase